MNRWELLCAAVESVAKQSVQALETILVIDHNGELLERSQAEFADAKVVANSQGQGLSGARNTGIEHAAGDVIAFLDDDASAEREWIEHRHYFGGTPSRKCGWGEIACAARGALRSPCPPR